MANEKYLEKGSLAYFISKIKEKIPTKTSDLQNDSGFITADNVPEGASASTTTPAMDGEATVGTETTFARGDHVHPSDTDKVDKVPGKGLSTNDLTDELLEKINNLTNPPITPGTSITLTNNSTYTTTSDGYFSTYIRLTGAGNNKYVSMTVGGEEVARNVVQPNEYNRIGIFIRKGMTIRCGIGSGITDSTKVIATFYPLN